MNRNVIISILAFSITSCAVKSKVDTMTTSPINDGRLPNTSVKSDNGDKYTPNTLIITYDPEVGKQPLLDEASEMKCTILYEYNIIPGVALQVPDSIKIDVAVKRLGKVKGVLNVERDRIMKLD